MCHTTQVATIVASPRYMKAGFYIGITMHSTDDFPLLPSGEISHSHEQPNSALYAGFTSGSTGEPKGFVIEHAAFTSGLDEYCAAVNLNHDSRVFQFASYSFVIASRDSWHHSPQALAYAFHRKSDLRMALRMQLEILERIGLPLPLLQLVYWILRASPPSRQLSWSKRKCCHQTWEP